ncbi:hypothetical protein Agabi119p4_9952 [Agaricus bisporus var. burnettii]|uniref:Uncharacterized protein n=1 Tax=Agaricus bisporus var. burnettii TaxID=192524 RepID=A0A8H7C4K5_AGABI|nr:hypothetical protein Agabi119p4_9952 [Agaricus bisporus var. burnettii]
MGSTAILVRRIIPSTPVNSAEEHIVNLAHLSQCYGGASGRIHFRMLSPTWSNTCAWLVHVPIGGETQCVG